MFLSVGWLVGLSSIVELFYTEDSQKCKYIYICVKFLFVGPEREKSKYFKM